ncbi:MAG: hypothetical protein ACI4U3_00765 [Traorella sp.]
MSQYESLWKWIKENDKESIELTFLEISQIIGKEINHSFLNSKKELLSYGYQVKKISMKEKKILFEKIKK